MARIVPTILLHFLQSLPASCLPRHLCLHVHRPWRSEVGGTSPRTGEVESRLERRPRITSGTRFQGRGSWSEARLHGRRGAELRMEQLPRMQEPSYRDHGFKHETETGLYGSVIRSHCPANLYNPFLYKIRNKQRDI